MAGKVTDVVDSAEKSETVHALIKVTDLLRVLFLVVFLLFGGKGGDLAISVDDV